ncbi:MAG: VCBS repeat-containing protein, partial [Rhodanobacteraceae bacterium]|nr:VCBS repeat-containing protein [Rhodanobacteraceae bacterium]
MSTAKRIKELALLALVGGGWASSGVAQTLPALLAPPPASVCVAPTAPTEPGDVHMFPGRWWNPQRSGIGWDFFYGEGQQSMYLTWFTYDTAGRPVWLHGENKPLQFNAVTGERTWQSNLYEARWTFTTQGRVLTPVGSVSVTFPNQTTTRAAVRWRWDRNAQIPAVGSATYDECIFDTFRDQRALRRGTGVINQAFSSNWFYRGINEDPLVGWGVDLLVDIDPNSQNYVETAAAAIFDTNGRPVWLQSEDDWGKTAPSDDTINATTRGALRYIRFQPTAGAHPAVTDCSAAPAPCGLDADHDATPGPDTYGRFGRTITDAAYGRMYLVADVPASVTGAAAVDWPPPNNVPALPDNVPVMRFDANHVVVDKTVCRVPGENDPCTFQVSWSTNDPNAQIRRRDLNNGGASTLFASGLSNVLADTHRVGARVQYEITYRYNGTGVLTTLRTPEVRVLRQGVIADANVENIACTPAGTNGCDRPVHDARTGAIPGEASTDGGAAQYSIPITLPPGRNGMEPQLALSYSSRNGNGLAGLGWSLSGLSAIHRCPRTMAQDGAGKAAAVNLDNNDALCLDGQRLVRTDVNGAVPRPDEAPLPYGVNKAYYRTELNNFARITQYGGDLASSTTCFKVEHKSGEVSYYGGVSDGGACQGGGSRQVPDGVSVPLSWNLERHQDALGNSVLYTYSTQQQFGKGEKLLMRISYTGTGAVEGNRIVELSYGGRPPADRSRSYLAGGLTERTQRLTGLSVFVAGTWTSQYLLNYTDPLSQASGNLHSGRSALQSVQYCAAGGEETAGAGAHGQQVCLPKTLITWNDLPPDYVLRPQALAGLPDVAAGANGAFVDRQIQTIGDLDGDGVREVLVYQRQSDQQFHTWLVKQSADRAVTGVLDITAIAGTLPYFTQGMQTDYDGDGRADLLAADEGGSLRVYRWSLARGANFGATPAATFASVTLGSVPAGAQLVGSDDADGDGQADLLLRRRGTDCGGPQAGQGGTAPFAQVLCYYRNTTTVPGTPSFAMGVALHHWSHATLEGGLSPVGDLNGDGNTDLVITTRTTQPGGEVDAITTLLLSRLPGARALDTCTAASSPAPWYACAPQALNLPITDTGYRSVGAAMRWHDVNGDGLSDLLYALPSTCTPASQSCPRGSWKVQIATGRGFAGEQPIEGNTDALLMTTGMKKNRLRYAGQLPSADLDSDGKADLLYPVALAARQCTAVTVDFESIESGACPYDEGRQTDSGGRTAEPCRAEVWMCSNDPAADITGQPSAYSLPSILDMPAVSLGPGRAITTDNLYSVRTRQAVFEANDQSLYYMAGLRFVATSTGYVAESFSLDASAGSDRGAHRVAMTLASATSLNSAEDLYGDGLTDLITRVGCYNAGLNGTRCHFVGNGTTGPAVVRVGPVPVAAPVTLNVSDFNQGLRSFVNENVGFAEAVNGPPTLPGLVHEIRNGLGDQVQWKYFPLSSKASRTPAQVPLYTLPDEGYVDSSHFYFQSTLPVVGLMWQNSGVGSLVGFRSWRYGYSEAMYNRMGRGFQGFRAIVREQVLAGGDAARGVRELTQFHQKYPLTGKIERTRSGAPLPTIGKQPLLEWVRPFTEVRYTWGCHRTSRDTCVTDGAPAVNRFDYPFLSQQITTRYDVAEAEDGRLSPIAEVTQGHYAEGAGTQAGWDAFGNLTDSFTVAQDLAAAPGSVVFVTRHKTRSHADYVNTINADTWWPGQLRATQETLEPVQYTGAHPLPADVALPTQTRHTDYTWNPDRTPATVTVEKDDPLLRTQKVFTYPLSGSNYGLPEAIAETYYDSVAGSHQTRTTQTRYTGGEGYFPTSTVDATGAITELSYRARDGQLKESTLPTQVRVRHYYDAFGRTIRSDTLKVSGGVETLLSQPVHTAWNPCTNGVCEGTGAGGVRIGTTVPAESLAAYRITTVQNGSPTRVVWQDLLGREVKRAVRGFDGTFVASLSDYDRLGLMARQSVPFFLASSTSAAPFASTFTYDRAGRLTSKTSPDAEIALDQTQAPGNRHVIHTYAYAGNRTTVRVRNSRQLCVPANLCVDVVRYSGVAGLMRTEDAQGGVTRYWADAAGRPAAIADARTNAQYPGQIPGGQVTRASYNVLGHRTQASDPNQGSWSF